MDGDRIGEVLAHAARVPSQRLMMLDLLGVAGLAAIHTGSWPGSGRGWFGSSPPARGGWIRGDPYQMAAMISRVSGVEAR